MNKYFCVLVLGVISLRCAAAPNLQVFGGVVPGLQYLENDKPAGPATKVLQYILDRSNLSYGILLMNFAQAHKQARTNPNSLIFAVVRTPTREQQFLWLIPIGKMDMHVARRKDRPNLNVDNLEGLKRYQTAVVRGANNYETLIKHGFKEGIHFSVQPTAQQLFRLVAEGFVDFVFYETTITPLIIKMHGVPEDYLTPMEFRVPGSDILYIAGNSDLDPYFKTRLLDAYDAVKDAKEFQSLLSKVLSKSHSH